MTRALLIICLSGCANFLQSAPDKIIFDTDMASDCDDAGAPLIGVFGMMESKSRSDSHY